MFTVKGISEEIPYLVYVDVSDADAPISGSRRIQAMLEGHVGELVEVTPTGPYLTLTLADEGSILAALAAWTTVTAASGDVPQIIPAPVDGAVY